MGASANATDCDGVSVLHAATAALCAEAICDLLAAGAHVNAHDALGRSPLHYLVCGRVDVGAGSGEDARRCIRALVEGGASLSFRATSAPCPGPPYEPGAALLETVLAEMDREHLDTSLAGECSPWSLRPARL
jgi:ankyrin repeat protein